MAVMASETPINPVAFAEKAPLAQATDTPTLAEKPVNGDAPHYDAPIDDARGAEQIAHNHMSNGTGAAPTDASTLKPVTSEDASVAPVEHVEGGISGVAAFLPSATSNEADVIPPPTEPPATMTEPAPVEPATSDVRDEPLPLPENPAQAIIDAAGPQPGEPSPAPASTSNSQSPSADKMDTTEDGITDMTTGGTGEAELLLNNPDIAMDTTEPQASPNVSAVVTTIPPPAEESKPETPQEAAVAGQVRPREEDDEVEPVAKRAKTESVDEDVPAPTTETLQAAAQTAPTDASAAPPTGLAAASTQAAPPALPQAPPVDSNPLTGIQEKFLLEQVRKAKKTKSALAFLNPVDWQALNIPSYPEIIKHPMDLKTMEEKLKTHAYANADEMMTDFETMVHNAQLFNGPQHPVAQAGQSLRAYFHKCVQMIPKGDKAADAKPKKPEPAPPKVTRPARTATIPTAKSPTESKPAGFLNEHGMPIIRRDSSAQNDRPKREIHPPKRDLPASSSRPKKKKAQLELKFCETVVTELHKKKYAAFSYPFLFPVDPVALNIPNYLRVIKKPMDFGTVQQNLKNGQYQNAKECYQDCKLVFGNCYKFNPPTDEVYKMGKMLEDVFEAEWAKKETWIQNNMPPSEPATEDEEEEEEEPEEEEDPNMRRMQEIQAQIAALSAEAMQLTNAPRRASPKAVPKKASKSGSSKTKAPKPSATAAPKPAKPKKAPKPKRLTLDQKREVSDGIANLDEAKMRKAVQIIRNGVPSLANVQDDELELDIDEIPEDVVYKLWEFVKSAAPKREREPSPDYMDEDDDDYTQRGGAAGSAGGGRRKNKPMKAQEQEERIKQLQEKLSGGGAGGSASPGAGGLEGYAESEGDSESSEEE